MIGFVKGFFVLVLVAMTGVTTWASMDRSVFEAGNLLDDPWGVAPLFDAYFGFLTFYLWVFYKERGWLARIVWLLCILCLGNMAMAIYALNASASGVDLGASASWAHAHGLRRQPAAAQQGEE